ncbi:MAG: peptidase M22, partial [Opitutales bacterium]
ATAELAGQAEPLRIPSAFRAWAPPPRPGLDCPYDAAVLLADLADHDLLTATEAPEAFQHEAPVYRKWTAEIHRAAPAK